MLVCGLKMRCAIGLICLFLVLSGAACRDQVPADVPLVRVNDRVISVARFDQAFRRSLSADEHPDSEQLRQLRRAFLAQLIDRELILAEADRLDIRVTPAEVAELEQAESRDYNDAELNAWLKRQGLDRESWRRQLAEDLRIDKVIDRQVRARIQIDDQAVADWYRAHQEEFHRPEQVRARQIVVASRERGEEVLARLRRGEDFAEVARAFSLSPDAEQGGDLGWFARGRMPREFDQTVFSLARGQMSGLVQSPYGWHVFLLEDRRPARNLKLAEARAEIEARLRAEAEQAAFARWLERLRRKAHIQVDFARLDASAP
ncbi:MAG: hypothetical protein D6794_03950 [Deltaproteobacteria bacterium]|nr:MAG: hypothetical protein D6794_03950 [Deltaproteobacteria bacterium]